MAVVAVLGADIRGNDSLGSVLLALTEGAFVDLEADGLPGSWEKMRNGHDRRPTSGLKPQGVAIVRRREL